MRQKQKRPLLLRWYITLTVDRANRWLQRTRGLQRSWKTTRFLSLRYQVPFCFFFGKIIMIKKFFFPVSLGTRMETLSTRESTTTQLYKKAINNMWFKNKRDVFFGFSFYTSIRFINWWLWSLFSCIKIYGCLSYFESISIYRKLGVLKCLSLSMDFWPLSILYYKKGRKVSCYSCYDVYIQLFS